MRGIVLAGMAGVAALIAAWLLLRGPAPLVPAAPGQPQPTASRPPAALAPAPQPPRFDVARLGARGALVTAGRAAPGAEVQLMEGPHELGRARADSRGEWVILPAEPLAPGLRELSLLARLPGQEPLPGAETVVLLVPEPPAAPAAPLPALTPGASNGLVPTLPGPAPMALLLPPPTAREAPRPLQTPLAAPGQSRLSVDVVDYEDAGGMRFAGAATPGAVVRLYVDDAVLGDAIADTLGRWSLSPAAQPGVGRHRLRADQLAQDGRVVARVEVPFLRDNLAQQTPRDGRVVVQPGNSLWRLARYTYGQGLRYTVIYAANRDQIREPGLIYPGQVFALPAPPR